MSNQIKIIFIPSFILLALALLYFYFLPRIDSPLFSDISLFILAILFGGLHMVDCPKLQTKTTSAYHDAVIAGGKPQKTRLDCITEALLNPGDRFKLWVENWL